MINYVLQGAIPRLWDSTKAYIRLFERVPDINVADAVYQFQGHQPVSQQPQRPSIVPFWWIIASQGNQLGFHIAGHLEWRSAWTRFLG
jgi:hypothetical protein